MGSASQVWPLTIAIVSAIEDDTTLASILKGDKVYNTMAPPNSPMPYITLGLVQEQDDNVFGGPGVLGGQVMDIWTRKTSVTGSSQMLGNRDAVLIYASLRRIFHNKPITVTGFRPVLGVISLLATMLDPDGETVHAIVRYDLTSREA